MKKVLVIGGTGKMGQATAKFLKQDFEVFISGRDAEKTRFVAKSLGIQPFDPTSNSFSGFDFIFVSVPIPAAKKAISSILPLLSENQLLVDLSSVKFNISLSKAKCSVLLVHQMFGPDEAVQGQNMILIPLKGENWKYLADYFSSRGVNVVFSTVEQHNRMVAYTQALTHFISLSLPVPQGTKEFSTPNFRRLLENKGRIENEKEMIAYILTENPESLKAIDEFISSCRRIRALVKDKNTKALSSKDVC